ncbi:MAG: ribonuclease III [Oscillospiraceae bacterium]|jgi:ribonuclease-3|nr:ribonuclease III [Oscillospiraceae bacterium]
MKDIGSALGYAFRDGGLLATALTHPSYANENRDKRGVQDNQRLEFLGDSVLGFIVAHALYLENPAKSEGDLTRMRSRIVCEASLAGAARKLNLGAHMRFGRGETGMTPRASVLADAFEAVLAAIYLDGGRGAAERFVRENLLDGSAPEQDVFDYKTAYQEKIQAMGLPSPCYEITATSGPEHAKTFQAAALVDGKTTGRGAGQSKKAAEQAAAKEALEKLQSK